MDFGQFINLASVPVVTLLLQLAFTGSGVPRARILRSGIHRGEPVIACHGYHEYVLTVAFFTWALWGFHCGRINWLSLRIVGAILGLQAVSTALDVGLRFAATGRLIP